MVLKKIVDKILKENNRSLSWLAAEMDRTFDGLKLSLTKGSVKYVDLKRMAKILNVPASRFFEEYDRPDEDTVHTLNEDQKLYSGLKSELQSCQELVSTLKSQVKDKEKIIELLSSN